MAFDRWQLKQFSAMIEQDHTMEQSLFATRGGGAYKYRHTQRSRGRAEVQGLSLPRLPSFLWRPNIQSNVIAMTIYVVWWRLPLNKMVMK